MKILPFDLTGSYEHLEEAARAADAAFDGAGVDFLFHNAGARAAACGVTAVAAALVRPALLFLCLLP